MLRSLLIFIFPMFIIAGQAQDFSMLLPEEPAKNSKENTKYLVSGIALQVVGLGLSATSVYLTLLAEEEGIELGFSGFGMGLGIAAAGTALVATSVKNIALERRAIREYRKEMRKNKASFNTESTHIVLGTFAEFEQSAGVPNL